MRARHVVGTLVALLVSSLALSGLAEATSHEF